MPVIEDFLWKHPGNPGMIVVSAHAVVEDGRLHLGYGEAQEAARRIPEIEYECAEAVCQHAVDGVYGFLPVRSSRPGDRLVGFGLFQTRTSLGQAPDLEIIRYSMDSLRSYVEEQPELKIRMSFPGVGDGGLEAAEIAPLLLPLPQTVTICHRGEITPSLPPDFSGFKALYLQVESLLQESRYDQAVELLVRNGFDIQSAFNQVNAVQRLLNERLDADTLRLQRTRRFGHQ